MFRGFQVIEGLIVHETVFTLAPRTHCFVFETTLDNDRPETIDSGLRYPIWGHQNAAGISVEGTGVNHAHVLSAVSNGAAIAKIEFANSLLCFLHNVRRTGVSDLDRFCIAVMPNVFGGFPTTVPVKECQRGLLSDLEGVAQSNQMRDYPGAIGCNQHFFSTVSLIFDRFIDLSHLLQLAFENQPSEAGKYSSSSNKQKGQRVSPYLYLLGSLLSIFLSFKVIY